MFQVRAKRQNHCKFVEINNSEFNFCHEVNRNEDGTKADNLPVMVFIFGGSYEKGTADDTTHGPDFIVEHGVILVTIGYRLGVLGFMSLGSDGYSGNMGLKDQLVGLEWIYENIGFFGGNSSRITLSGHSAGWYT